MPALQRFAILTNSTQPLRGIVEIDTAGSTVKFELNEDIAHQLCTDLERFLTQAHGSPVGKNSGR